MSTESPLYSGKAKSLYATDDATVLRMEYRNDTSAFNGEKLEALDAKGMVNNYFNAAVMTRLAEKGVPTHFIERMDDTNSRVKYLEMLPIECVVRNVAAGSICRRLGVEEGSAMEPPLLEFFYKDDALGDPLITEDHILQFGWATREDIEHMREYSLKVNQILSEWFFSGDMILVDYKLEFGRFEGALLLGDEFTPDGCRIWDIHTRKKLDKDRFRESLGGVVEGYCEAASRLGIELPALSS